MRVEDYNKKMEKIIAEHKKSGERKKLLLHACCAPCASSCIERVKDNFDLTVYFYNPNVDGEKEYYLRANELVRLCQAQGVKVVVEEYNPKEFFDQVKGLENQPEGGRRCEKCFLLRLKKSADYAKDNGFDYFTTTLTVSPLKNASMINGIGEKIEKEQLVNYLPSDFKKKNGYLRSIELSREYNLYRQNYCGCTFSKNLIPN